MPKDDPMVRFMLSSRKDIFADYTQEGFEQAFGRRFSIRDRLAVAETKRTLYLLERRD